jgi:hypothetical protein
MSGGAVTLSPEYKGEGKNGKFFWSYILLHSSLLSKGVLINCISRSECEENPAGWKRDDMIYSSLLSHSTGL